MEKARFYKKLKDDRVECTACEWHCNLGDNEVGICGVRQNESGDLYSLVYGNAISVHTDPVEKKPLFHFLPGEKVFSIGTVGCNFGCGFCQNWDISQVAKDIKTRLTREGKAEKLGVEISSLGYELSPKKAVEYCQQKEIPMIAYTYNEPTVFIEYALDTARLAKKQKIKSILVTNGYMAEETIPEIARYIDAANIDLKAFTDGFYKKVCKASLAPVLRNIELLYKSDVWIELTTLLIPGENDSESEMKEMAAFIASVDKGIPWHISRFHPDYEMKDKNITSDKSMLLAFDIGKAAGLEFVYLGNVSNTEKMATVCPKCGELLIERSFFGSSCTDAFEEGVCKSCKARMPGVWRN